MLMHRREKESSPVNVAAFEGSSNELAPYYVDAVNRAMDDLQRGLEPGTEQSIRVQTTIDPDLQTAAENALRHQLELLSKSARGKALPQGAMVALDVRTGQVLAMVGGRSYSESQLTVQRTRNDNLGQFFSHLFTRPHSKREFLRSQLNVTLRKPLNMATRHTRQLTTVDLLDA